MESDQDHLFSTLAGEVGPRAIVRRAGEELNPVTLRRMKPRQLADCSFEFLGQEVQVQLSSDSERKPTTAGRGAKGPYVRVILDASRNAFDHVTMAYYLYQALVTGSI